jgi:hypothetical protein
VKEDKGLRKELLVVAFDNEREKTLQKGWSCWRLASNEFKGGCLKPKYFPFVKPIFCRYNHHLTFKIIIV